MIASSLHQLLNYEGNVEEDFMQPFCITYDDLLDGRPTVELKDGGSEIFVNRENRNVREKNQVELNINSETVSGICRIVC